MLRQEGCYSFLYHDARIEILCGREYIQYPLQHQEQSVFLHSKTEAGDLFYDLFVRTFSYFIVSDNKNLILGTR